MRRVLIAFWGVTAIALPAHAEPNFPAAIQDAAHIPCAPPCALCHTETPGTALTATKAFTRSLLATGKLVPGEPDSLRAAIAVLSVNQTDSDGDGTPDTVELAKGGDPSESAQGADVCGPSYGCEARVATAPPRSTVPARWLWASGLALAVLARKRRRR
jgi:hypothetical protein